ncbi:MAG: DNA mismatch repair protein MutS [Sphingobacteriales bacterium]|nr:MAG: DNA mismatch repair protein MutS [Sphingobacteriales bacterium]
MQSATQSTHQQQLNDINTAINRLKKTINTYSFLRLILFFIGVAGLFYTINYSAGLSIGLGIIVFALFLFLVGKHAKLLSLLNHQQHCATLLQNEIDILNGKQNIYCDGSQFFNSQHAYTSDLDIFGQKSLFAYLNRAHTNTGKLFIANWLQQAGTETKIGERANALLELNENQNQNLNFRASLFSLKPDVLTTLKSKLKNQLPIALKFINTKKINFIITLLPLLTFAILAIAIAFNGIFWSIFSLQLVINFVVYNLYIKPINTAHNIVSKTNSALKTVANLIKNLEEKEWQTPYIKQIVAELKNPDGNKTYTQIQQLSKITTNLDYRNNILVGIVLNLFFCWDLRVLKKLYHWEATSTNTVIQSFDVIAHFEALISLATLNHNHPNWVRPIISPGFSFDAQNMAHPLIAESKSVSNHFNFAQNPSTDIITGSNMAGKSTFLRTLGINMVLAFTGANVCANYFKTSVFTLVSYMRIIDSLDAETSTFKAEINRLKMILELTQSHPNTLVLIDEMLRGTNSKDKYEGSKALVEKLVSQQTSTLFATHDLQIAQLEQQYPTQIRNFNFDVKIDGDEMFFDYKIKTGECKTFNAAVLLKAIGLG